MAISPAQFLQDFPEINAPASAIRYWLRYAAVFLDPCIWGASAADPWPNVGGSACGPAETAYDIGTGLLVAHNLTLTQQALAAAANGAPAGVASGPVSAKHVDKVSINYDTASAAVENAGPFNLTTYGQRFILLAQQMGSVPLTIGLPGPAPEFSGQPWIGPPPWPGFFG